MLEGLQTTPTGGQVEYALARNAVVREYRKGRLSRLDVCDAHPELLRAARNLGRPTGEQCPICEDADLVDVTFVFGARLPSGGRCVAAASELERYWRRKDPVVCYVVEVCAECSWNHLARMYPAGAGVGAGAHCGGHAAGRRLNRPAPVRPAAAAARALQAPHTPPPHHGRPARRAATLGDGFTL